MTQKEALDILKTGVNVYITGAAGSGKTHLLNTYIDYLKEHDVAMGITASTGIAATHMGGVTIHSWTGLGVRDTLTEYDLEALQEKQYLWKRMEKVKVLIIDEVSMLHHFRLDLIENIIRTFKRNDEPFGGIQVILCGDFFQLPPVSRRGEPDAHFVYHSDAWKNAGFKVCYLEEQFRQQDDHALRVLNDIRGNKVDEGTMVHLRKCFVDIKKDKSSIEPTRLHTHNVDVDSVNEKALIDLKGETVSYEMQTKGNPVLVEILKKSCLAPELLKLKIGAKVMFVKNNFENQYANGTLGIVTKLRGYSGGPVVETLKGEVIDVPLESWTIEEDSKIKAELKQYPLRLAWAITVHKSQGMSLDAVEVDLSKSFEKGMGYVALSRVRTLAGLTLLGLNDQALEVNQEVLLFDEQLQEESKVARGWLAEIVDRNHLKPLQLSFLKKITPEVKKAKVSTYEKTRELICEKITLKEIAERRGMTEETILSHVEKLLEDGEISLSNVEHFQKIMSKKKFEDISKSLLKFYDKNGDWRLAPVKNALGSSTSYRDVQVVRLFVKE